MMTTDDKAMKVRIKELLVEGKSTLSAIAREVGTSRSTVSLEKIKLEREIDNGAEQEVSSLSPKLILAMADKVRKNSPKMAGDLERLSEGISSMHNLEPVLHKAIESLVNRCETRILDEDIKPSDFKLYGELILKAFATVNHQGAVTQINVNQQQNTLVQQAAKEKIDSLLHGIIEVDDDKEIRC